VLHATPAGIPAQPNGAKPSSGNDLRAASGRVDALLAELAVTTSVDAARDKVNELVSLLVRLYGTGLEHILTIVYNMAGDRTDLIFNELCKDDLVASLLILHGLHPLTLEERIERALDRVRSYLHSHEGDIELLRVEDGVAYLRLAGSCHGCPSSTTTVRQSVERAIFEAAPEIREIRAEGLRDPSLSVQRKASPWIDLDELPDLDRAGVATLEVEGTPVLLCRHDGLYAYRNQCPHCFVSLTAARIEWPFVRCASCGTAYDVTRSGRAHGSDDVGLEPFPMVVHERKVQLAIPVTA
jgi:Fe-S cluster biogenesis protein NfuA/nitrite reductase/ring-hydroxylating ferredoxin subunit